MLFNSSFENFFQKFQAIIIPEISGAFKTKKRIRILSCKLLKIACCLECLSVGCLSEDKLKNY